MIKKSNENNDLMIHSSLYRGTPSPTKLLLSLVALICCSCSPSQNKKNNSEEKDLLVYCSEGSPDSFNPQLVTSGTSYDATANIIYNQLVTYKPGTTEIAPSLAKSWSISDDGLRYTFNLRKDIPFHGSQIFTPSRNLNADDVIFSFNRQRLENHPYHAISGGRYPYFKAQSMERLIEDIRKTGEHQVEFVLTRPESPFLSILATPFASILSAEYAQQLNRLRHPEWIDNKPIGTGPFRFERYEPDAYIRYKRFDDYFSDVKRVKNLVFAITPDAAMRFARFSAGECDVMSYPLPVHLRVAQKNDLKSVQTPGLNVAYWAFNTEKPPFHDAKVRQALTMAVDREAILQTVYDRQATMATNPIPPSSWAYNKNITKVTYSKRKALELLKEAGYENGFSIDIWAMPIQRAYNPNARKMAEMIQQDLADINVDVRIITYEWGTFLSRVSQGLHHSVLLGWNADNADPNNFFSPLLSCSSSVSGNNYAKWCNNEFDDLILKARTSAEQADRTQYYLQAQKIFKQEAPWLTIAHANNSVLVQPEVDGLIVSPIGNINFEGVTLKPLNENATPEASN
ncbi:Extracellular solute-binding protein family 5 [Kangiella geojedonensis]|uniref:Extracellular solute-binding protein family 5 n=2 Tax=Kangiella geojedonensis TaxID=914150 RepID=A0A0F6TQ83_9GAMM|nr:ABC transporter substrate-binding protein [Kangiella geojedonensis]AKE51575.1 Extracellular solute-binding protein family 5 [Kangiella geojedonensis]